MNFNLYAQKFTVGQNISALKKTELLKMSFGTTVKIERKMFKKSKL